ncbi:uncharacterized protein LOC125767195 isoform X3 [Anopheles funestus]|uniref:uncharacterized protein LOC125767195 isoform X3 n=1 Tax=Anopheles funestus TaxID=62324 RepID=UPI0020C616FD|nr:uncharacterized protein LOC125767195 isoform X3 [Anopheles funestus]
MKVNILIVSQTLALHQYQCLFVNSASSKFKENIYDVLDELTEFITAVGLSTEYIITILGQLGREVLRAVKKLARTREIKIIIIEEPAEEDPSEDCSFVRDLTNEAKKQLFEQHNLKLFGTTIALNNIVRETDSLSLLFNVLEKYDDTDVRENYNFNLQNFEKIKSWYIPRSFVPYSEENREAEQYLTENEITASLLKSVLPLKDEACNLPDDLKCEDNVKVHIFLDEAGYGKSTYFTWLASAISNDNSSMFIVRMNALQYSSDFFYLQALDPKTIHDTEVVRILYRLLHLTLFVCNIHNRAVADFDKEREKADRTAKLLTFSDGKIILDETNPDVSKLPLQELLELRLFQNKFNENKFICLLDGFDEIVPHYKDFVMKYFARLSNFEGIRNLYISTRPYNFREELKQTFSVGKLWRLEPFSQRDRILFLNNYVEHELEGYKKSNEDHKISILEKMYTLTTYSIQEFKIIPLFLHMAAKLSLSKIKIHLNAQKQTTVFKLLVDTKFDQLQVISNFVEEKLRILNHEKAGTIQSTAKYPVQIMKNEEVNKQTKRRHNILGMLVIFNIGVITRLLSDQEQQEAIEFMQDVARSNEKTGIIQDVCDNIPRFTHRIFAEYFTACWLYENRKIIENKSFFRSRSYWTTELHRVRDFHNRMILSDSKGCDIHMAVINQSEHQVRELLSANFSAASVEDAVGRLPLHLAMIYPSRAIENFLISKTPIQSINLQDKLLHWTALDYAFAMRSDTSIKNLLFAGVTVNGDTLLQQIVSNNLKDLMLNAHDYGKWLSNHESYKMVVIKLHLDLIKNLATEKQIDIFSTHKDLDSLTVVEFCVKYNMVGVFKQLMTQIEIREKILADQSQHLLQMAIDSNASEIETYLASQCNMPLLQTNNSAELIAALKSTIKLNQMIPFKIIFQQLCHQLNITVIKDVKIVEDIHDPSNNNIASLDKVDYPKVCCVRSSNNVRLSLPEYDEKDILHKGYLVEALLARAVHEGHIQIVKYIVQKNNMVITNRLIVMVMRLLPKGYTVCHEKSMSAFIYLLDKTTDRNATDDEGRSLLHMTAQNGCFFMLHCMIAKGCDPAEVNTRNGWNVFHYVAFNQDEDRSDNILEFLLKYCGMDWFHHLDTLVDSDKIKTSNNESINTTMNPKNGKNNKLNKNRHALLAMFAIFRKDDLTSLLSDEELQEAIRCMQDVAQGNEKSDIIKGVKGYNPEFTLRIFAEYFAASWIYSNKHRMKSQSFFRSWKYWNGTVQRTRSLFNHMIVRDSEGCDIHMAVINESVQQVRALVSKKKFSSTLVKDSVGRLPLHLAVIGRSKAIKDRLIKNTPLPSINAKDELFEWSALDYAFASGYGITTTDLLTAGAAVNRDTLFQQIISNDIRDLLSNAHNYGKWLHGREKTKKIANQLHIQLVEYLLNEKHLDVFSLREELDTLTILEFCTKHNMVSIVKLLMNQTEHQ